MKEQITAFIDNLIFYDYILFGSLFVLFLALFALAIALRKKIFLLLFIIILDFGILGSGLTVGYFEMHKYLFKNKTTLISQKKLNFVEAVVVKGSIENLSKFDFQRCLITASINKTSKNSIKNFLFSFKPISEMSILQDDIRMNEVRKFKIIVEPFTYSKDYNVSIKARCK